jgi:RNA recognition motif-containing protein
MKEYHFDTNRTIFVGDLSYFCTEDDLVPLCSPFGHITAVKIRRGNQGKSLLFGFVENAHQDSTELAFADLHGKLFMGRNLK